MWLDTRFMVDAGQYLATIKDESGAELRNKWCNSKAEAKEWFEEESAKLSAAAEVVEEDAPQVGGDGQDILTDETTEEKPQS